MPGIASVSEYTTVLAQVSWTFFPISITFEFAARFFLLTVSSIALEPLPATSLCGESGVSERWLSARRLYSSLLGRETTLCKTPHFQWIYGKLRSDQMDPKPAQGGPKPISRTGGSLLENWSYTSNPCIYFSILLDWRAHLAKTLFIPHKYIKCALL